MVLDCGKRQEHLSETRRRIWTQDLLAVRQNAEHWTSNDTWSITVPSQVWQSLQHEPSKDTGRQNRVHIDTLFTQEGEKKCTNSAINRHDVLTADESGLMVRWGLGAVVYQLLVDGLHMEPGAISLLPHMATHLLLCKSVGDRQRIHEIKLQQVKTHITDFSPSWEKKNNDSLSL